MIYVSAYNYFIPVSFGQQGLRTSLSGGLDILWVFTCSTSPKIPSINKNTKEQEAKYSPTLSISPTFRLSFTWIRGSEVPGRLNHKTENKLKDQFQKASEP